VTGQRWCSIHYYGDQGAYSKALMTTLSSSRNHANRHSQLPAHVPSPPPPALGDRSFATLPPNGHCITGACVGHSEASRWGKSGYTYEAEEAILPTTRNHLARTSSRVTRVRESSNVSCPISHRRQSKTVTSPRFLLATLNLRSTGETAYHSTIANTSINPTALRKYGRRW